MTAEESVRAGRLDEALADLQAQVRKQPADPRLRIFLFQLLCVLGQWDRALNQLKVASEMDPNAATMMATYKEVLRCEMLRAEVFAGKQTPLLFGQPAEWMALLLEALRLTGQGKYEEAVPLRERAFEAAPTTAGSVDGQAFEWIGDADPRIGPMLEAIVNGRYYWIPFNRLSEISVEKPVDLRDVAWMPVTLTLANGGETVALVPTRYPGTEAAGNPALTMARGTEWVDKPGGTQVGLGQRVLATDQGEYALMDVRVIALSGSDDGAVALEPAGLDDDEVTDHGESEPEPKPEA
jgi:type VI secretion system protein ImpE